MRALIVSDIHSNILALDAVIDAAGSDGPIDALWCLGDIVGYGPAPMACLERLWEWSAVAICGNHDAGAIGRVPLETFNPIAAEACRWNGEQLTPEARQYLADLPTSLEALPFTLVHGTPRDPLWEYLTGYPQAAEAWDQVRTIGLLVGHSHLQFICEAGEGFTPSAHDGVQVPVGPVRLVVNPGSVGQPRDHDPRAAYAVYDDDPPTVSLHRASYAVSMTQRAMAEAGLPEPLIARLSLGR